MLKTSVHARRRNICNVMVAAAFCLLLASCSNEPRGGPRIEVIPAKGSVTVDGEKAYDVVVTFHPNVPHKLPPGGTAAHSQGLTDKDGNFVVSTYETADGLPVGEYKVAITWNERSGMSMRQRGGPDRLNGKYEDPETTGFTLKVEAGQKDEGITIPTYELTTE